MWYTAVVLLPNVAAISGYIILNSAAFSVATVTAAAGALFIDVLGLMGAIWKVVLNPESVTRLNPVTETTDLDQLPTGEPGQLLPAPEAVPAQQSVQNT